MSNPGQSVPVHSWKYSRKIDRCQGDVGNAGRSSQSALTSFESGQRSISDQGRIGSLSETAAADRRLRTIAASAGIAYRRSHDTGWRDRAVDWSLHDHDRWIRSTILPR